MINTGTLTAPGGTITIAAVPGEKLVRVTQDGSLLSLDLPVATKAILNPVTATPLSLPALLTGGNLGNATGLTVENGVVKLTGSGLPVQNGDVVAKTITSGTATLSATNNVTLVESQLRTTGDLNLLANNTVTVRDSVANPVVIQSGKNLTIQGNQGVDILALNHPSPAFQSVGNLSLISDGIISGDAHYASGSFSIRKLDGTPGKFISYYDPIISANGDVTFGLYTGVSLKVEATGNITTGNIFISGNDPAFAAAPVGSDRRILGDYAAVILRAGVSVLTETAFATNPSQNPPFTINTNGTDFNGSAPSTSSGRVTVGNPLTPGAASISARYVDISAPNGILIYGPVVTDPGSTTPGGYVKLFAIAGDVTVHSISSGNLPAAPGRGGIDITAGGLFRATGTLDSLGNFYLGYNTRLNDNYLQGDLNLVPFLVNKIGASSVAVVDAITNRNQFFDRVEVLAPVSLKSYLGTITIRYASGGFPVTIQDGVVLQGGDAPFVIGPNVSAGAGEAYIPVPPPAFYASPTTDFSTFVADPFSLRKNYGTYSQATIPAGESGTVGAIVRTASGDGSFTVSVQNRVLGVRSITVIPEAQTQTQTQVQTTTQAEAPQNTVSSTAQQTVQRTFINPDQNSACNSLSATIASSTTPETRSPDNTRNPCTSAKDEAQILQILGDDSGKGKGVR